MKLLKDYWEYIALKLSEEHIEQKAPKEWTKSEVNTFLAKMNEAIGITVSNSTFRRIFKNGDLGKKDTRDIFAKYLGFPSHEDIIQKNNLNSTTVNKASKLFDFQKIFIIGLCLMGLIMISILNYRNRALEVDSDKGIILETVKKGLAAEFRIYKSIPNYEDNLPKLANYFLEKGAAYNTIVNLLERKRISNWVINNQSNPSVYELREITLDTLTGEYAYVSTKEYWRLEWFSLKTKRYEYIYDVLNEQTYTLKKCPYSQVWKIHTNQYNDQLIREVPQVIKCSTLKKKLLNITLVKEEVITALQHGSLQLAFRLLDCYYIGQGLSIPDKLVLLNGKKNNLLRDLNTDKINHEQFLLRKEQLAKALLTFTKKLKDIEIKMSI